MKAKHLVWLSIPGNCFVEQDNARNSTRGRVTLTARSLNMSTPEPSTDCSMNVIWLSRKSTFPIPETWSCSICDTPFSRLYSIQSCLTDYGGTEMKTCKLSLWARHRNIDDDWNLWASTLTMKTGAGDESLSCPAWKVQRRIKMTADRLSRVCMSPQSMCTLQQNGCCEMGCPFSIRTRAASHVHTEARGTSHALFWAIITDRIVSILLTAFLCNLKC